MDPEPDVVVDADGSPVSSSVVVSAAAPSYAPAGRALVSTSVVHEPAGRAVGDPPTGDDVLLPVVSERRAAAAVRGPLTAEPPILQVRGPEESAARPDAEDRRARRRQ